MSTRYLLRPLLPIPNRLRRGPPSIRHRFRREGEAIAHIVHPNVVDVLDVGEENGSMYVVMEYLEQGPSRWQVAITKTAR